MIATHSCGVHGVNISAIVILSNFFLVKVCDYRFVVVFIFVLASGCRRVLESICIRLAVHVKLSLFIYFTCKLRPTVQTMVV